jgi:uncharacterized protein (TIGR00303 family)
VQSPILFAAAAERGRAFVEHWRGTRPSFWCVLAHTDTCLIPGISAAGMTEALRVFTPAVDAEVVCTGRPRCLPRLPSHPSGVPGPAGITRAALGLASLQPYFVGTGLRVWPTAPVRRVPGEPGGSIADGHAVPRARRLFDVGCALGERLARDTPALVLGESVPGGTTTALALLLSLGVAAEGRISGSVPDNAPALKASVARAGLAAAGLHPGDGRSDPLGAAARIGDPMQPLAAGMAAGATRAGTDVLLAGGSQMVAVAALLAAVAGPRALERVAIGTTRWVVDDPAADVAGLAADVSPDLPLLAVNLDFGRSRHACLHPYERWLVKEGVGAGGACLAALMATSADLDLLHAAIDDAYDEVLAEPQADA